MLTYQHRRYIRKALDSILGQEVNFNYEIVIGDDFSTDGTREILIEYKNKYPDKIKLILNEQRKGPVQNLLGIQKDIRGKYIALLEGDDFWTDNQKLQIQVDFLEQNESYSGVFHDVSIIGDQVTVAEICKRDIRNGEDYIRWMPHIPTCSLVYRAYCMKHIEKYCSTYYLADRIIHALILKYGNIKCLDKKMAAYRHITHKGNSYSAQKTTLPLKEGDDFLNNIGEILHCQLEVKEIILYNKKRVLEQMFWENHICEMIKFFFLSFTFIEKIKIFKIYKR